MPTSNLATAANALSEAELVAGARRGSAAACRALMTRYNQRLFRLIRGVLQDEAEAEDALQETYIRALSGLAGFKGEAALGTWLSRIAINEALGRRRRTRPMQTIDDLTPAEGEEGGATVIPFPLAQPAAADPEHAAARTEIRRLLEGAIDALPDPFRVVFMLRAVEQLSLEETADCLGIPEATVKTRLHRAKARLRDALADQLASALADTFPFAGARCARLTQAVLRRLDLPPDPPPE